MNENDKSVEEDQKLDKLIEKKVESKFNEVMNLLPSADNIVVSKRIHEYTITDIYNGTLTELIYEINVRTDGN